MSNSFIRVGPDGKLVFTGKEDPKNPPIELNKGSQMECPICHGMFDYLVGEDTPDGGKMGCEACYKPSPTKKKSGGDMYDKSKEISLE